MPSFALADPLWWVARWAARLLAGLAVVGALTLGSLSTLGAPPHTRAVVEPTAFTDSGACGCATASPGTSSSLVVAAPAARVAVGAPAAPVAVAAVAGASRSVAGSTGSRVTPPAAHGATPEVSASVLPVAAPVPASEAGLPRTAVLTVRAPRAPPGV
ncbi:hypothetical protein [Micromonospora avicenniae]|uniref:hypothetical protein n=1 Tax=Micromonospora avicenniae TaxID=1198245 RepID=UPI003432D962